MPRSAEAPIRDPGRWAQARQIFAVAIDAEPRQWQILVERYSRDPTIRSEVLSLLAAHRAASGFLECLPGDDVVASAASEEEDPLIGRRLGSYRLVEKLAQGGMGVVYAAVRDDGAFDRKVAVKVLPSVWASAEMHRRFEEERRILAAFDHPNIAGLLDGGATDEGALYLVMEYVEGLPIDRYCTARKLGVLQRVELFLEVCDAVEYAHQRLVVHRDLKPMNILVADDGTPKLLDFGIAKLLREGADGTEALPASRLVPMTPEYASPEQIRGESISTASDVFSLGVVLYRLLSGRHPYASPGESPLAAIQAACEREPVAPSQRAPSATAHELAGDLDAICLRALEKQPRHRYPSVAELAADLRRHLERRPVQARRGTATYRAGRFLQRHRLGTAVSAALLAGSALFTVVTVDQRNAAERAQLRAEQVTRVLADIITAADPWSMDRGGQTAHDLLSTATETLARRVDMDPEVRAELLALLGEIHYRLGFTDDAEPLLEDALALRTELSGDDSPELRRILLYLGRVETSRNDLEAAEVRYQKALEISRQVFGEKSAEVGSCYSMLGHLRHLQGRVLEAEDYHLRALELIRETSGAGSVKESESLGNLGSVLWSQGRHPEAINRFERALAIQLDDLGPDHPRVAVTRSSLGSLLGNNGGLEAAERQLRLALEVQQSHFSDNHPDLATTRLNLGSVLLDLGRNEEAEELLRRSVAVKPVGLYSLAEALERLGRPEEALERYREALDFYAGFWPGDDLNVGVVLSGLAGVLHELGEPLRCEEKAREAVERLRRADLKPSERRFLAEAEAVRGSCLVDLGRTAEAEPLLEGSLALLGEDPRRRGALRRRTAVLDLLALAEARGDHDRADHYRRLVNHASAPRH